MTPTAFWARVALATALAATLVVMVAPPRPRQRMSDALGVVTGAAAGITLFTAALRRPPALARPFPRATAVCKGVFLALCAANEEVLWRWVLLGELLRLGPVPAVAISSAGFAIAHPRARALHLLTGATFGLVYVGTGVLAASIAAHWVYNALVASGAERAPP
jgi:membrane protease YdiL (CAAX protease family)